MDIKVKLNDFFMDMELAIGTFYAPTKLATSGD